MFMALNERIKVKIPDNKITFKKGKGNAIYVYYTIKAYRRTSDGRPTSDEVCIGKKDQESGMLIPNSKYYELFTNSSDTDYTILSIRNYGPFFLLDKIASSLNLIQILKNVFPNSYKSILTCAFYMVTKGNVMKYANYWSQENVTYLDYPLVNQRISELFASITFEERMKFFKLWTDNIIDDKEYIAYDVTSISSYSPKITTVEYGYNRDGEDLPQINLGMYIGEKTKLPIFYNTYSGSIVDKEQLIYMLKYTKELGIEKIKFVMDKGFYKRDNLRYMINNNHLFLICLSNSYLFTRANIEKVKTIIKLPSNWIDEYQVFGYCMQYKQDDITANLHIIYNPDKQVDEQKIIYSTIYRLRQELETLEVLPEDINKYERFFDITKVNNQNNKFTFILNEDKVLKALATTGYAVFMTTDLVLSPKEVLAIYRNKDVIEKCFDNLKNELDFSRLRTHEDKTTEGKIFVGFISLILRMYLSNKLNINSKDQKKINITTTEVLLEMEKIKITSLSNEKTLMMQLTKLQKDILACVGTSADELLKSLDNLPR